ncbi:MAG: alpha-amylase [Candidatus Eisenbacteria bacterium]|nr:alpha-amylase [Candidatus Eisenbacteria bacterium]
MRTPTIGPFEFHLSRAARERCRFDGMLFATDGRIVLDQPVAARQLAQALTAARGGEPAASAAELYAMGLLDEAMHLAVRRYRDEFDPRTWLDALDWFTARLGADALERTLVRFVEEFPPLAVHVGETSTLEWLAGSTDGQSHRAVAFEEMLMLWLGNANPACEPYRELFDDRTLTAGTAYARVTALLREYFETRPRFGPELRNLVDFLRAPVLASPNSLFAQVEYVRERWSWLLGDFLLKLLIALDVLREEQRWYESRLHARRMAQHGHFGGDSGPGAVPQYGSAGGRDVEYEAFSPDEHWMPRTVLIAKSTYVWLDQLAREYKRPVTRLDEIPDEELDRLASFGITGLWLIGLWERSAASQRIKQLCGNPDAAASAYSLWDYRIANDLGGEDAYRNLRDRAAQRGVRLASDMVPNHMGLDSRWVVEHPEWFLTLPHSPYPAYRFDGPDLSGDSRVELKIEDHYYDRTDAAVVFRRMDRATGDTRYVYHGNDGTSFPWNDTAQIDYLNPAAREQVIQTILDVARKFPIIRFDAAMTLAKRHVQRLWFPEPGSGGAIPSRAEHGLTRAAFDAAMPHEFWREVVDRVAVEAPGTLLLAEAFWLMEGYFVRTLGMHRVYNSAFMNMLRDEQNANYRTVIKNTLEFDPEILQRYVNFMNNPDERTAVDQFGRGEKYFGTCVLLATLPGLPMIGHGQIEGFEEKYGMEFRRAQRVEDADPGMVSEHWRRISPLLHLRWLFSGASDFRLYDCWNDHGGVNEDVYAYSNRAGATRALVLFHNRWADAHGWIRTSASYADKRGDGSRPLVHQSIAESFGFDPQRAPYVRCRDLVSGLEFLYRTRDIVDRGVRVELAGFGSRVLLDWREVQEDGRPWGELCNALQGQGTPSLDERMLEHELAPVHLAMAAVPEALGLVHGHHARHGARPEFHGDDVARLKADFEERLHTLLERARWFATGPSAPLAALDSPIWAGAEAEAVNEASRAFDALLAVSASCEGLEWAKDPGAREVLPLGTLRAANDEARHAVPWVMAVTLIAARAIGRAAEPAQPTRAALRLFDAMRLRRGVFEALAFRELGWSEEDRWRDAALVRAALAHHTYAPGGEERDPWRHDHDVRWLIGTHEAGGTEWFRREDFARFVWWRALDGLLVTRPGDEVSVEKTGAWIEGELVRAQATGWKFAELLTANVTMTAAPEAVTTAKAPKAVKAPKAAKKPAAPRKPATPKKSASATAEPEAPKSPKPRASKKPKD